MPTYDPSEMETGEHRLHTVEPKQPLASLFEVDFGAVSDRGKVRTNNEDHYLVGRCGRAFEPLLTNLPAGEIPTEFRETAYGLIVADGLGGEAAGELASRLAIATLVKLIIDVPDWILKFDAKREKEAMKRADTYIRQVHETLTERAKADAKLSGMGTTMTLATILGHDGIVAHVGDSRAYLYRQGELHQLTRDQTQAQMLLEAGVITKEEFARNQYRHVLLQAIGGGGGLVDVEIHRTRFQHDDRLLLCTDGLTDMVPDSKIAEVLGRDTSAQKACESLLELALEAGGRDNVTCVLGHVSFPQAA
ncbi:MAG: PP2C family protein-serine/threonine phosphatase [Vicinamibacteria bacterium]